VVDTRELADGPHALELQAVDAAGNMGHVTRSFFVDNNAPVAWFDPREGPGADRVTVTAADAASGVAGGGIEMRRVGSGPWRALPTSLVAGRLYGSLPAADLDEGTYEFRATVTDRAGNSTQVDRTSRGTRAEFVIPGATRMSARIAGHDGRPRVRYGRAVHAVGTLRTRSGAPLASTRIAVLSRPAVPGAAWGTQGEVTTDGDGTFEYRLPVGPSRDLRFKYPGSEHHMGSSADAGIDVPSTTSLKSSRTRVEAGGAVVFRGRVRGGPLPKAGKLVDLQAHYRGRWRTFALPRTDGAGRWKRRYRFGATSGLVRYRFRARVPAEEGYAYLPGRSRTRSVVVDGR
jgi:hypothetical protein